ncbi:MAG: acyltransferase [Candidatus Magasanikbacteria bacterium]|nr:acyltransferase [Candidatus Magasanikbacteria bacterium]
MHPLIGSASEQTWLVVFAMVIYFLVTVKPRDSGLFTKEVTASVKGVAILLIIFGHVGYFFISDHAFLPPLSNFSGIGVDMFLLVSGMGLMLSSLKSPLTIWQFYKRRLSKVYIPVLISMALLLILDFLILNKTYPLGLTIKNIFGIFPQADIFNDINSPLWFITPLLVYYLIWPLVFSRRAPWILPVIFFGLGYAQASDQFLGRLPIASGVYGLYQVHASPFVVGTLLGFCVWHLNRWYENHGRALVESHRKLFFYGYRLLLILAGAGLWLTLMSVDVNSRWQEVAFFSLLSSVMAVLFVAILPVEVGALVKLGAASFFLYVIHTPLMTRFDFLFRFLPSGLALVVYLAGLMVLWRLYLRWRERRLLKKIDNHQNYL